MRVPVPSVNLATRAAASRPERRGTIALRTTLKVAAVLLAGTVLGLSATAWVLERRIDIAAVRIGPWIIWPKAGTVDIDPYARAIYARSGQIALASAEGLLLFAQSDDAGVPLTGTCSYEITGQGTPARFWTLSAATPAGTTLENAAGRYAFTSAEVVRRSDGRFAITAASSVRPGNWLPLPGNGRFTLSLRLYDSPLGNTLAQLDKRALPSIRTLACS